MPPRAWFGRYNFHHSSFVAGGPTRGAGLLQVRGGLLEQIIPHSGHYKPNDEEFCHVLQFLTDQGVNTGHVDLGEERWRYGNF